MRAILLLCLSRLASAETLTLEDAIQIARSHHPAVMQQRAQLELLRARSEQARSAFLPALTGSFAYQPQTANFAPTPGFIRSFQHQNGVETLADGVQVSCLNPGTGGCAQAPSNPTPPSYSAFNYWSAGLGIYWTLWDWGRSIYGYKSSTTQVDSQKLNVQGSINQVTLDVKLAYFGAVASDAAVKVSEEAVATQQRHLDQARAFFQVGTRTKIDVASAESDHAAAELTLAKARGALQAAQAVLAAAIGDEHWRSYQLIAPTEYELEAPTALENAIDEALKARPEPRAIALQAKSYEQLAKSARGQFLPALVVSLGPTFAGTDISSLVTNFQASLALSFPVFGMNPWLVYGQMREADANHALAEAQGVTTRNNIRLETAQAHAALSSAREEIVAAKKLVTAATERRNLAEGRYQAGVGSIIELSDAELNFVNARFQEVQATLDLASGRARLDHALGR
jgi:outer membrane protein